MGFQVHGKCNRGLSGDCLGTVLAYKIGVSILRLWKCVMCAFSCSDTRQIHVRCCLLHCIFVMLACSASAIKYASFNLYGLACLGSAKLSREFCAAARVQRYTAVLELVGGGIMGLVCSIAAYT
jgi:hypothetical protein